MSGSMTISSTIHISPRPQFLSGACKGCLSIANMDSTKGLANLALHTPSNYWSTPPTSRERKSNILRKSAKHTGKDSLGEAPTSEVAYNSVATVEQVKGQPEMSSQRKRADRGRSGGNGGEQAEQGIWDGCQESIRKIVELVKRSEECRLEIFQMEAEYENLPNKPSVQQLDALSALQREQVKLTDQILAIGRTGNTSLIETLKVLRGLQSHNEGAAAEPSRRGGPSRDAIKSAMDFDISSESPAPSPMSDKPTRKDRGLAVGRGSLPPKDVPIKQERLEAGSSSGVEINAKGKIIFKENAEVAFRLKQSGTDEPEWIQGVVVKVIGEGKSRRYDVQDPEPDEVTKLPGAIYRTSAASMVPIPPLGHPLPDYAKGKAVLARYPDTTTFYRAEVVGMNGKLVNLRFEGEEDAQVTMEVDRRFVLDHRG